MNLRQLSSLITRYILLIISSYSNLFIFYFIFTPLTVYPVSWVLGYLYQGELISATNSILIGGEEIQLIEACIAGAAYYFLLILNLATPMKSTKRIKSIAFTILSFLIINILRIIAFTALYLKGYEYFDVAHKLMWYFGSTLMLIIIWFVNVWIFKISNIPVYTDFRALGKDASVSQAKHRAEKKK